MYNFQGNCRAYFVERARNSELSSRTYIDMVEVHITDDAQLAFQTQPHIY